MTRGGKRNPVGGRPKAEGETKTTNLCGVRVKPSRLEAYRDIARANATTVSRLVEMAMALFVADVQDNEPGDAFDALVSDYQALDLDKVFASYVKGKKL